ncbi:MAG TPA: GNAT family N-acetyltransferase [Tepidisphaeraceae bacterium]
MSFRFLEHGRLIDGELELIRPSEQWVDALLRASSHPLTQRDEPSLAGASRRQVLEFLQASPLGRQPPNPDRGFVPQYHFWMRILPGSGVDLEVAGGIGLRIGVTPDLERYIGHIGYHVYPPARGRHYAERACRLLLPLARGHGISTLWITCNPENVPSRRTCQRLGAELVDIVPLPKDHLLYSKGERYKCRYRVDLQGVPPLL